MAVEETRLVRKQFGAGSATTVGPITITDKDGLLTRALAAVLVRISGVGKNLSKITGLRVSSLFGEIISFPTATFSVYRAWLDRMAENRKRTADADLSFVIPFFVPDIEGAEKYKSLFPRESSISINLDIVAEAVDTLIDVATVHVRDADDSARWVRRLAIEGFTFADGVAATNPIASEGKVRTLSFATAGITRIRLNDNRPGIGEIHNILTAHAFELAAGQGGLPGTTLVLDLDPDGDEKGLLKMMLQNTILEFDVTGGPISPKIAKEEFLPRV